MDIVLRLILLLAVSLACTGCTHTQLRSGHVNQAKTLTGIYEKQILDNLAMFVANNEALPFFAVPKVGSVDVTDAGALSASPLNGPAHTVLSLTSLSRNNKQGWTIDPVSDPTRLILMRCAYRRAIGMANPSDICVDCCEKQMMWKGTSDASVCCDCCAIRPLAIEVCSKRILHNPCEKVGSYCNTHIRVLPESYEDLTRLVLTILEYAVKTPTAPTYTTPGLMVVPEIDVPRGTGNLLDEAIRQRSRDTLFPQ